MTEQERIVLNDLDMLVNRLSNALNRAFAAASNHWPEFPEDKQNDLGRQRGERFWAVANHLEKLVAMAPEALALLRSVAGPKCQLVDRITRPKHAPGVNWGGDIVVFARRDKRELWKTPGANAQRYDYVPGELVLVEDAEGRWRGKMGSYMKTKTLQDGGRVSKKTFAEHAQAINDFFGCDVAAKLDPRKTLIIEE